MHGHQMVASGCRKSTKRPFRVDTVEKVFWGWRTKFSRAADTFRVQRCEGPRPFSEKRPRTAVLALLRASTASVSKSQHLRDFWRRTIFDFFNSIDPQQTLETLSGVWTKIGSSVDDHEEFAVTCKAIGTF
jgi:hypothetical protein